MTNDPDIAGPAEAATILNISRQRLGQLLATGRLPPTIRAKRGEPELGIGKVWAADDLRRYKAETVPRKPGPKPA